MLQHALGEVTKIHPPKLRLSVDEITAFMNGTNKELVDLEKVLNTLRDEFKERALMLSRRERRKEQGSDLLQVSGGWVSGLHQERSSGHGDEC